MTLLQRKTNVSWATKVTPAPDFIQFRTPEALSTVLDDVSAGGSSGTGTEIDAAPHCPLWFFLRPALA